MSKRFLLLLVSTSLAVVVCAGAAWLLGAVPGGASGLLWLLGAAAAIWTVVLLKAPWDLWFESRRVSFEIGRSRERGIDVPAGRERWVRRTTRWLLALALAAHAVSAALAWWIASLAAVPAARWLAGFFLLSASFRPAVAGYRHLWARLRAVSDEITHPREDVVELRARVAGTERGIAALERALDDGRKAAQAETAFREAETRELREKIHSVARELERAMSRLTDNQDVIKGIQAFVRLVSQSGSSA